MNVSVDAGTTLVIAPVIADAFFCAGIVKPVIVPLFSSPSGPSSLILHSGTLVLTGANTYSAGTTISGGTLQLGNGGASGSILGNVIDNATLAFDRRDTVTFANLISGTGKLTQLGTGTTILTANNTYTGGTTITAGTLQIGNGGTAGSIVGDVIDNSALIFDHSDSVEFSGVITGSGSVTQVGTGALLLTGANTYSGGTTNIAGTLRAGSTTALSATSAFTVNSGLDLNGNSNTVGSLAGSGTVTNNAGIPAILTAGGNNSSTIFSGILRDGSSTPGINQNRGRSNDSYRRQYLHGWYDHRCGDAATGRRWSNRKHRGQGHEQWKTVFRPTRSGDV